MYARSAKADLEAENESTEGLVHSTAKLRELILSLTNQKVDIMIDSSTIKSTYDIYKELSNVWDEISDVDQAALLEALGGKRKQFAPIRSDMYSKSHELLGNLKRDNQQPVLDKVRFRDYPVREYTVNYRLWKCGRTA